MHTLGRMSKPSRRHEIQSKEKLQAEFQQSLTKTNDLIRTWLDPGGAPTQDMSISSNESFFDLPVVLNGASLSSLESSDSCIGDFIKGGVDSLAQVKRNHGNVNPPSKAMTALLHKMRDSKRDRIQGTKQKGLYQRPSLPNQKPNAKNVAPRDAVDSDDSDDGACARAKMSVKKGILFATTSKKARPF